MEYRASSFEFKTMEGDIALRTERTSTGTYTVVISIGCSGDSEETLELSLSVAPEAVASFRNQVSKILHAYPELGTPEG
jgi:hypothetical protein